MDQTEFQKEKWYHMENKINYENINRFENDKGLSHISLIKSGLWISFYHQRWEINHMNFYHKGFMEGESLHYVY